MNNRKDTPTGKSTTDENGDVWFEVIREDGVSVYLPEHPDVVYTKQGTWKGWCNFLGLTNVEEVCEVCEGMTKEERAIEMDHAINNGIEST